VRPFVSLDREAVLRVPRWPPRPPREITGAVICQCSSLDSLRSLGMTEVRTLGMTWL